MGFRCYHRTLSFFSKISLVKFLNPLSANFTKWSNTLKKFIGNLPTNCLSVFLLCILYLKSTHKNSLRKTNNYRLIDATLTPGDQVWSVAAVATDAATTYSDEV